MNGEMRDLAMNITVKSPEKLVTGRMHSSKANQLFLTLLVLENSLEHTNEGELSGLCR